MWKSTQTLQHMHALSTQRKANKVNDVNGFPIEGTEGRNGVHGAQAPFSTYSWQNGTLMTINPKCTFLKTYVRNINNSLQKKKKNRKIAEADFSNHQKHQTAEYTILEYIYLKKTLQINILKYF